MSASLMILEILAKCIGRQDEIGTPFCVTIDYKSIEDGHGHDKG